MKRILLPLILLCLLAGCQQSTDDSKNQTPSETKPAEQSAEKLTKEPAASASHIAIADVQNSQDQSRTQAHEHEHEHTGDKDTLVVASPLVGRFREIVPQSGCDAPIVMEFYAYQCPHCYKLEPYAAEWKKTNAAKIAFRALPTNLGKQEFGAFLLVHHAAQKLGIIDTAIGPLFDRIHKEKNLFRSEQDATEFLVKLGADPALTKKTLSDQEAMNTAIGLDFNLMQAYKITSVPTIIVNHQYQTDVTLAGGYDQVFSAVDEMLSLPSSCGTGNN